MQGTSYSLYRSIVPAILFLIAGISWSGGNTIETLDLSRPPDYRQLGTINDREKLSSLRDTLGDALTSHWKDSRSGRSGSSFDAAFAKWVDLYQWLDLLESNENEVMKRWLSRHLNITAQQ